MVLASFDFEWWHLLYLFIFVLSVLGFNRILTIIRYRTLNELNQLLMKERNYFLYQELLSNKKLRLAFSKKQIALLKLKGFMMEGKDQEIIQLINMMNLKGYSKLDYLLKRFTYFIEVMNSKESKHSLNMLEELTAKAKDNKDARDIIQEARLTYAIYIDRDTSLIHKLNEMIDKTDNDKVKGIIYYRLAKLYYFDQSNKYMNKALAEAKTLLAGTYYEDIIMKAQIDPIILEKK
jgi:hydrogenase maturation factor